MQLTDLNEIQKALCEILWQLDDHKEVGAFLDGLPIRIRQDAHNMIELMLLETIDNNFDKNTQLNVVNDFLTKKKDID